MENLSTFYLMIVVSRCDFWNLRSLLGTSMWRRKTWMFCHWRIFYNSRTWSPTSKKLIGNLVETNSSDVLLLFTYTYSVCEFFSVFDSIRPLLVPIQWPFFTFSFHQVSWMWNEHQLIMLYPNSMGCHLFPEFYK